MFLVVLHLCFYFFKLIHLSFLFSCPQLNLFLELNRVKRLWKSIRLHSLPSLWGSSLATWRSCWLLMYLFESSKSILYAHLASITSYCTLFCLLFLKLSPLICRKLFTIILNRALFAERQWTSYTQSWVHARHSCWMPIVAHLLLLILHTICTTLHQIWRSYSIIVSTSLNWTGTTHTFDNSTIAF